MESTPRVSLVVRLAVSAAAITAVLALGAGCDDGAASAGTACTTTADCGDGTVCVAYGAGGGACQVNCSASVNACSGSAQCGPVSASLNACQEPAKVSSSDNPPKEETRPRVPCASDEECKTASGNNNAICAQFKGAKDCTLPCSSEPECTPPAVGGVTFDFAACLADEGDSSRMACLPDEACWSNPTACISGLPGGIPGF